MPVSQAKESSLPSNLGPVHDNASPVPSTGWELNPTLPDWNLLCTFSGEFVVHTQSEAPSEGRGEWHRGMWVF